MKLNKLFVAILIVNFLAIGISAHASTCVVNEATRNNTPDADNNYKLWAMRKICFDNLLEPKKFSIVDDKNNYFFFGQIDIRQVSYPVGGKRLVIKAIDKNDPNKSVEIFINQLNDGSPVALIYKDSDGFELVSSL